MAKLGLFPSLQVPGAQKNRFVPMILGGRKFILGNPITAWGYSPPENMSPFANQQWALIDPESSKIIPLQQPVMPDNVQASIASVNSALNTGLITGAPPPALGYAANSQIQSTPAQAALVNTSIAPAVPSGCSSCGGTAVSQVNGVIPAANPTSVGDAGAQNQKPVACPGGGGIMQNSAGQWVCRPDKAL